MDRYLRRACGGHQPYRELSAHGDRRTVGIALFCAKGKGRGQTLRPFKVKTISRRDFVGNTQSAKGNGILHKCLDDAKRGKGYGKEMLRLALKYAFEILHVHKVTLGVFENNSPAYYCYRSVGFTEIGEEQNEYCQIKNEKWKCIELEMKEADYESNYRN